METSTLKRSLTRWLVIHRIGKLPSTRHYYKEIVKSIRRAWRDLLLKEVQAFTADDVALLSLRCSKFSSPRWNAIVRVAKYCVPAASGLKRQPVKLTRLPPPTPDQFARLIEECAKLSRSRAKDVADFLGHSGLRITAARRVKWSDVYDDRIEYVGKGNRRCSVPIIQGMRDVLKRLRKLEDGSGYVLPRASIRNGLMRACDGAGIRRLSHHDFRHMFTTRCIESGVDVPTVARWRGDSDGGAMLSKRYFHLLDAHSRRMAGRVRI